MAGLVSENSETSARCAWSRLHGEHEALAEAIDKIKSDIEAERESELEINLRDFHLKTMSHFQFEEAVMKRYDYPYYGDHKAQHDDLITALESVIDGGRRAEPVRDRLAVMIHLTRELQHCVAADQHLKVFLTEP